MAKLRKNERNEKEKDIFLFSFPSASNFGRSQNYEKTIKMQKESPLFFLLKKDVSLYYPKHDDYA